MSSLRRDEDGHLVADLVQVSVPVGSRAVFVSNQLLERHTDWTSLDGIEARVVIHDGTTADVEIRYTSPEERASRS